MTNEQLAEFIQTGSSDELIPVLWEKIKPLIYMKCDRAYTAKTDYYKQCGVEVWDMKQACYSAYLAAIKYYKPESGYKFTTFLIKPMQNAINELTGCKTSKRNVLNTSVSLDQTISDDEGSETSYIETIADPHANDFIEQIDKQAEAFTIWAIVNTALDKQSCFVITSYFRDNMSLKEIAQELNVSTERARQIKYKALRTLARNKYIASLEHEYCRHNTWINMSHLQYRPDYYDIIEQLRETYPPTS